MKAGAIKKDSTPRPLKILKPTPVQTKEATKARMASVTVVVLLLDNACALEDDEEDKDMVISTLGMVVNGVERIGA